MEKEYYRRNLPHIQPRDGVFFITFRLDGSLPLEVIEQLTLERELYRPSDLQSDSDKNRKYYFNPEDYLTRSDWKSDGRVPVHFKDPLFEKYDALLDNPSSGPVWLRENKIATIVKEAIHYLDNKDYKLICYSIMSNHVHMIVYQCQRQLFKILQSLKRFTAQKANASLGRTGTFWKKESYDNLVRDMDDLAVKINYVLQNPVKAGVVEAWEKHPFTYCNENFLKYLQ